MCIRYDDCTVEPGSVERYPTSRRGLNIVGFIGKDFLEDVRCQRRQWMWKVCQKVEMWPMNTIWKGRQRYTLEGARIPWLGAGAGGFHWVLSAGKKAWQLLSGQVRKLPGGGDLNNGWDHISPGQPFGALVAPCGWWTGVSEKTEDHRCKTAFFLGPQSTDELTLRCPNAHSKL